MAISFPLSPLFSTMNNSKTLLLWQRVTRQQQMFIMVSKTVIVALFSHISGNRARCNPKISFLIRMRFFILPRDQVTTCNMKGVTHIL